MIKRTRIDPESYTSCVSCWHANSGESDAMWALYAQRDAGIAIKTTVANIQKAFEKSNKDMLIAKVNYDSEDRPLSALAWTSFVPVLIKRHAFHHENEVRIVLTSMEGFETEDFSEENKSYRIDPNRKVAAGLGIECDLRFLIGEIILSPSMLSHMKDAVISITKMLLPDFSIRPSGLLKSEIPPLQVSNNFIYLWESFMKTRLLLDEDDLKERP